MPPTILFIAVVLYVACAALNYALNFAFYQRRWPTLAEMDYHQDRRFCIVISFGGPMALLVTLAINKAKYGLKWR